MDRSRTWNLCNVALCGSTFPIADLIGSSDQRWLGNLGSESNDYQPLRVLLICDVTGST
eukprot:m.155674 g.155674  ORF g.155674 m.155674 type:complete len:59 (+) comp23577_c0_seq1:138-314(+)